MNYDDKCQLLVIGDSTVGKSSILARYSTNNFNARYIATVGLDFFTKDEIFENNKIIRVKIWDTAGQERYKALTKGFFRNAQGIILVYDVSNYDSFRHLENWMQTIKDHEADSYYKTPVILIANKIDLKKKTVSKKDGEEFAQKEGYSYFEVSAKTGEGVDNAIRELVIKVMKNAANRSKLGENKKLKMDDSDIKKKSKCCG